MGEAEKSLLRKNLQVQVLKHWAYSLTLAGSSLKYICIIYVGNLVSLNF